MPRAAYTGVHCNLLHRPLACFVVQQESNYLLDHPAERLQGLQRGLVLHLDGAVPSGGVALYHAVDGYFLDGRAFQLHLHIEHVEEDIKVCDYKCRYHVT